MSPLIYFLVGIIEGAAYKAAYVEHYPASPCGAGSCGAAMKAANAQVYASHIAEAARQGADILVFPEYGLTGESSAPKRLWVSGGYTEVIPVPDGSVPCDSGVDAPTIVALSCAAREHAIAVVANLMDYTDGNMYNTDVAFDTDGVLLAKYHKLNMWGEPNVDVPSDCGEGVFTTTFGVTFGMFTCADVMYQYPTLDLVSKGVTDFVMPAAWSNEMADMQVMGYAQGWSYFHQTNLVLSNLRGGTSSGSGVWFHGEPRATTYNPDYTEGSVHVTDVSDAGLRASAPQSRVNLTSSSKWFFAPLTEGTVCSGSVCCTVGVSSAAGSGWVVAALDGQDEDGGVSWGAQVCAVLPCSQISTECLTYQRPTVALHDITLKMSGISQGSAVIPEIVAWSGQAEVTLDRSAVSFEFLPETFSVATTSNTPLASAVVYGRPLVRDQLPYQCPASRVHI